MEEPNKEKVIKNWRDAVDVAIGLVIIGACVYLAFAVLCELISPSEPKESPPVKAATTNHEEITEGLLKRAAAGTVDEMKKFPQVVDVYINPDGKTIVMMLVLQASTNKAMALDIADSMIRIYSTHAAYEGSGTTLPTAENYGSLFDKYSILLGVAPSNALQDRSRWYYDYAITARQHTRQGPSNPRWK